MRLQTASLLFAAVAAVATAGVVLDAQNDPDRVIPGGGIFVPGWTGKIDAGSVRQGRTITDAKFAKEGEGLHVTTGPATTYWNPANTASGDYTVKATFTEPSVAGLNSHPHSYGIFIGGTDMGTDDMSFVYCVTFGDGTFLIRGFSGPSVFTLVPQSRVDVVHRATGPGQSVTQEIAWTVKDGRATCFINGTRIIGYDKAQLVTTGKLKSTDGVYGIRVTHNVEAVVTGFSMTKD